VDAGQKNFGCLQTIQFSWDGGAGKNSLEQAYTSGLEPVKEANPYPMTEKMRHPMDDYLSTKRVQGNNDQSD
jgi:hypothetical protein